MDFFKFANIFKCTNFLKKLWFFRVLWTFWKSWTFWSSQIFLSFFEFFQIHAQDAVTFLVDKMLRLPALKNVFWYYLAVQIVDTHIAVLTETYANDQWRKVPWTLPSASDFSRKDSKDHARPKSMVNNIAKSCHVSYSPVKQ